MNLIKPDFSNLQEVELNIKFDISDALPRNFEKSDVFFDYVEVGEKSVISETMKGFDFQKILHRGKEIMTTGNTKGFNASELRGKQASYYTQKTVFVEHISEENPHEESASKDFLKAKFEIDEVGDEIPDMIEDQIKSKIEENVEKIETEVVDHSKKDNDPHRIKREYGLVSKKHTHKGEDFGVVPLVQHARTLKEPGGFLNETDTLPVGAVIYSEFDLENSQLSIINDHNESSVWMHCDGREINPENYPELYDVISDFYHTDSRSGKPDKAYNIRIPKLEGYFITGGTDNIGERRRDHIPYHTHTLEGLVSPSRNFGLSSDRTFWSGDSGPSTTRTDSYGESETRPKNYAVRAYIKARH